MATVTFAPGFQDSVNVSETSTIEARLAALEHHFYTLLKWQGIESFSAKASDALARRKSSIQVTEIKEVVASIEEVSAEQVSVEGVTVESTPEPVENIAVVPIQSPGELAHKILEVIQGYGQHIQTSDASNNGEWAGKSMFVARVQKQVELDAPIKMILPAFPWKSINRVDKVTGSLPDLGEFLALSRLNSLCNDVEKVYPRGAQVTIATDGLAFDDLVGIPDEDTWAYSEALMDIAAKKGLKNIKLLRIMDFVGLTDGQEMNKDIYLSMTTKARDTLIEKYCRTEAEIREMIATDEDTLLTYRGFIRFLETDLKYNPTAKQITSGSQFRKYVKKVAMGMMARAESFTKLIQSNCGDYIRLSIHPSSGGVKLSVPLITQDNGAFPKTPWHSSVVVGVNGSYSTVHAKDVRDTHTLMHLEGRPFYFREKSDLWDWADEQVIFEPQYPRGTLVQPAGNTTELAPWQLEKLRQLAQLQPVKIAGFANVADEDLSASA